MAKRLKNLFNAVSESTGTIGAVTFSILGFIGFGGVYYIYERSPLVSMMAISVLAVSFTAVVALYLNALSHGEDRESRGASVAKFSPLFSLITNLGLFLSLAIFLAGDTSASYFSANPNIAHISIVVGVSLAAIAIISAFSWVFSRLDSLASGANGSAVSRVVETVEITEARVPTVTLQYSEKDRKRKAAHFAGRILCFASSPYVDNDLDFEINEEFAQIKYRGDNQFEDEGFLSWMVFQLLCAQQSEVAFSKRSSKISWEHYGDIEYYVAEILAARPGGSRMIKDPQTAAESDWRAKRIRFHVKETMPRVHAFLRANQDDLKHLVRSTMEGSLTATQLRSILRSVDTAHLPKHWDEEGANRNHLSLVSN